MTGSRKLVLKETAVILTGEAVCVGLMYMVYALLGHFSTKVLLGGMAGILVAAANFFFMAVVATLAADRAENRDVEGGQKLIRSAYPIRLLVLAAVLFACAKSGWFDLTALVLPLLFVRLIITIAEFFRREGV